jgi:RimJ/RimL family protein N-acetyltransferase
MDVFLETERLVLRRFTAADLDNLVDLDGDPEVMRFLTGGKPTPREKIEHEVLPRLLHFYEQCAGFGHWAAIDKSSGEFLGWFGFRPTNGCAPEEVELGYRLRKGAWGKGYATEGARALIRKGFTELGVQCVVATTMAVNRGSRRVMEKAGLRYIRTYHVEWPELIDGAEHGEVDYALRKSEWQQHGGANV